MVLNIKLNIPCEIQTEDNGTLVDPNISVSKELDSVSNSIIKVVVGKVAKILDSQGLSCFHCPKVKYMLFPLSDDCPGSFLQPFYQSQDVQLGLSVLCSDDKLIRKFELTLSPIKSESERRL